MAISLPAGNPCVTAGGRPAFVVNVSVYLHRDGSWLLIKRGAQEAHAPGMLSGVGGKVDPECVGEQVFEETARREVAEEIGVDLSDVELRYVRSGFFITDDADPVINVVLVGELPADAEPRPESPEEVLEVCWFSLADIVADPGCPPWTRHDLVSAVKAAGMGDGMV